MKVALIVVLYLEPHGEWLQASNLAAAIDHLVVHSRVNLDVIIWDNSPAPSEFMLAPVFNLDGLNVKIVKSANIGFGAAVNGATQLVPLDASWILLLNPDLNLDEDTLLKTCEALEQSSADIWAPELVNEDGSKQTHAHSGFLRRPIEEMADALGFRLTPARRREYYLRGAFLALRREKWAQWGGFDTDFFLFGEEVDLCVRWQRCGARLECSEEIQVTHLGSQGLRAKSLPARAEYHAAQCLIARKYYGNRQAILVASAVWTRIVADVFRRRLSPRDAHQLIHRIRLRAFGVMAGDAAFEPVRLQPEYSRRHHV
jgi:GT2 family glycosyltransferase